jgi:hypothetical protein
MCALSEVVWTTREGKSIDHFMKRLVPHLVRLRQKGINVRIPPPIGAGGAVVSKTDTSVVLTPPFENSEIRYTLDGTVPTRESMRYTGSLKFTSSSMLKAITVLPGGLESRPVTTVVSIVDTNVHGLRYRYAEGEWRRLPDVSFERPQRIGRVFGIGLEGIESRQDSFSILFEGAIRIEQEGEYSFYVRADDGVAMSIGGVEVLNSEKTYPIGEMTATISLSPGVQPLRIVYLQRTGKKVLQIQFEGPGVTRRTIPPHLLLLPR